MVDKRPPLASFIPQTVTFLNMMEKQDPAGLAIMLHGAVMKCMKNTGGKMSVLSVVKRPCLQFVLWPVGAAQS